MKARVPLCGTLAALLQKEYMQYSTEQRSLA